MLNSSMFITILINLICEPTKQRESARAKIIGLRCCAQFLHLFVGGVLLSFRILDISWLLSVMQVFFILILSVLLLLLLLLLQKKHYQKPVAMDFVPFFERERKKSN